MYMYIKAYEYDRVAADTCLLKINIFLIGSK